MMSDKSVSLEPMGLHHAQATYAWILDPFIRDNIALSKEPSLRYTTEWIRNAAKDSGFFARAIIFGDQHVGNIVLDKISPDRSGRLSIYLGAAESRGQGVGLRAVNLFLQEVAHSGKVDKVWLTVRPSNAQAIAIYRQVGFRETGILPREYCIGGLYEDALRMELDLTTGLDA